MFLEAAASVAFGGHRGASRDCPWAVCLQGEKNVIPHCKLTKFHGALGYKLRVVDCRDRVEHSLCVPGTLVFGWETVCTALSQVRLHVSENQRQQHLRWAKFYSLSVQGAFLQIHRGPGAFISKGEVHLQEVAALGVLQCHYCPASPSHACSGGHGFCE